MKFIKSLQIKKYRVKHSSFLVEGAKNVLEVLQSSHIIETLVVTEKFAADHQSILNKIDAEIIIDKYEKIASAGSLKTNDAALAVVKIPVEKELKIENELVLLLDEVKDPGNLGTIIRTADWYGIKKVIVSKGSVDLYNAKVIQASMGSFARVEVYYKDLDKFLDENKKLNVAAATLMGKPVQNVKVKMPMGILFGNESKGISESLLRYAGEKITIPRFGKAESLNVAMSAAIICDNIRRIERG